VYLEGNRFHQSYWPTQSASAALPYSRTISLGSPRCCRRGCGVRGLIGKSQLRARGVIETLSPASLAWWLGVFDAGLAGAAVREPPSRIHRTKNCPAGLARRYLDFLLRGERRPRSAWCRSHRSEPPSGRSGYACFRTPYMRRSLVAIQPDKHRPEHYCTAATQMIMAQLYSQVFRRRAVTGAVTACAPGETTSSNESVADFFEMEGWDTIIWGPACLPRPGRLRGARGPTCRALRDDDLSSRRGGRDGPRFARKPGDPRVKILVGGHAFNREPGLWRDIGCGQACTRRREALASPVGGGLNAPMTRSIVQACYSDALARAPLSR